jgi:hypothetical protein
MMKTNRLNRLFIVLAAALIGGILFTGCKKENDPAGKSLTVQQVAAVQNSDVQDAIADKSDQDIDKTMDELQANNYNTETAKAGSVKGGTKTVIVDHPDSTTFPKVVTIIYDNYEDSTADESFIKNGEIDILVTIGDNKQLVTRSFTFKDYAITTDSTTITANGTRTVERTDFSHEFTGLQSLRVSVTDNITANLNFSIVKTGETDSLKFTRVVNKLRTSVLHYDNIGGPNWPALIFRNDLAKDTITFSGTITGVNEKGDTYTKTVSSSDPLIIIFYKGTPVIAAGTLELTITGETADSFTITFREDLPNHPHKTLVTVTNNVTQATHSFDRRIGRKFRIWW